MDAKDIGDVLCSDRQSNLTRRNLLVNRNNDYEVVLPTLMEFLRAGSVTGECAYSSSHSNQKLRKEICTIYMWLGMQNEQFCN